MKSLLLTHDVSCVIGNLANAATRYQSTQSWDRVRNLMVAAVALTVQLAIDEAGRDPTEMRALERDLIAAVTGEEKHAQ